MSFVTTQWSAELNDRNLWRPRCPSFSAHKRSRSRADHRRRDPPPPTKTSALTAAQLAAHAQLYQAVAAQAAAIHEQFVNTLGTSAGVRHPAPPRPAMYAVAGQITDPPVGRAPRRRPADSFLFIGGGGQTNAASSDHPERSRTSHAGRSSARRRQSSSTSSSSFFHFDKLVTRWATSHLALGVYNHSGVAYAMAAVNRAPRHRQPARDSSLEANSAPGPRSGLVGVRSNWPLLAANSAHPRGDFHPAPTSRRTTSNNSSTSWRPQTAASSACTMYPPTVSFVAGLARNATHRWHRRNGEAPWRLRSGTGQFSSLPTRRTSAFPKRALLTMRLHCRRLLDDPARRPVAGEKFHVPTTSSPGGTGTGVKFPPGIHRSALP